MLLRILGLDVQMELKMKINMRGLIFIILALAFLASCQQKSVETQNEPIEVAESSEIPELSVFHLPSKWLTQENEEIELAELRGKVLVVAMIYSSCQFACPRLVADMKDIESQIPKDKLSEVNIILVSIDPERDQPDTLKQFAIDNKLDTRYWTLLHGSTDDVLEFAAVLGVKYKKVSPVDFSHSNIISLFNRKGELAYQQDGYGVDNSKLVGKLNALLNKNL